MFAWMNAEAPGADAGHRRGPLLQPLAERALAQGRHQRPDPAGRGDRASTATRTRLAEGAARGRRRRLPHRRAVLLLPRDRGRQAGGRGHDESPRRWSPSSLAAGLLTLTPGLDTALVLRTAAVEGPEARGAGGRRDLRRLPGLGRGGGAGPGRAAGRLGARLHGAEVGRRGLSRLAGPEPDPEARATGSRSRRRRPERRERLRLDAARPAQQPAEPQGRRLLRLVPAAVPAHGRARRRPASSCWPASTWSWAWSGSPA